MSDNVANEYKTAYAKYQRRPSWRANPNTKGSDEWQWWNLQSAIDSLIHDPMRDQTMDLIEETAMHDESVGPFMISDGDSIYEGAYLDPKEWQERLWIMLEGIRECNLRLIVGNCMSEGDSPTLVRNKILTMKILLATVLDERLKDIRFLSYQVWHELENLKDVDHIGNQIRESAAKVLYTTVSRACKRLAQVKGYGRKIKFDLAQLRHRLGLDEKKPQASAGLEASAAC